MLSKSFMYQQMHFISFLENIKIYIKTYIKTAPTCFGLQPSSGSLHMSLAKFTFIKVVKVGAVCLLFSANHTTSTVTDLINVTLAMLICKLLVDCRRPKHVGAILI